jgi:hypothetical protein
MSQILFVIKARSGPGKPSCSCRIAFFKTPGALPDASDRRRDRHTKNHQANEEFSCISPKERIGNPMGKIAHCVRYPPDFLVLTGFGFLQGCPPVFVHTHRKPRFYLAHRLTKFHSKRIIRSERKPQRPGKPVGQEPEENPRETPSEKPKSGLVERPSRRQSETCHRTLSIGPPRLTRSRPPKRCFFCVTSLYSSSVDERPRR